MEFLYAVSVSYRSVWPAHHMAPTPLCALATSLVIFLSVGCMSYRVRPGGALGCGSFDPLGGSDLLLLVRAPTDTARAAGAGGVLFSTALPDAPFGIVGSGVEARERGGGALFSTAFPFARLVPTGTDIGGKHDSSPMISRV